MADGVLETNAMQTYCKNFLHRQIKIKSLEIDIFKAYETNELWIFNA